jgi:hypothetical protein
MEMRVGRLLVIDWLPATPTSGEGMMFVFDGGTAARVPGAIRLAPDELSEWRMVPVTKLEEYLPAFMARRIRVAVECAVDGTTQDLEHGNRPRESDADAR